MLAAINTLETEFAYFQQNLITLRFSINLIN